MMLGQPYSTSQNCGIVRFVGGPYDGETGLYDHNWYDSISISSLSEECSHNYEPEKKGRWVYCYVGTHYWGAGEREYRSWFASDEALNQ
jgi:hypothetical protein